MPYSRQSRDNAELDVWFQFCRSKRKLFLTDFEWCGIRYDKLAANFLAMVLLASVRPWLRAYESTAWFSRAAWAITSMASGWRDRTLSESAPLSSHAR